MGTITGLLLFGLQQKQKVSFTMKNKNKKSIPISKIEQKAIRGEDVNKYFTKGQMMPPLKEIQRVNVDFTTQMLGELDRVALDLNISRQAVIKSLLMFALNQQRMSSQRIGNTKALFWAGGKMT